MNNVIQSKDMTLLNYMENATGGKPYDFKSTNGTENVIYTELKEHYRGMPINLKGANKQLPVFASARDIGNIGAGIIAGRRNIPWWLSRGAFDLLQTHQDREKPPDQISYGVLSAILLNTQKN